MPHHIRCVLSSTEQNHCRAEGQGDSSGYIQRSRGKSKLLNSQPPAYFYGYTAVPGVYTDTHNRWVVLGNHGTCRVLLGVRNVSCFRTPLPAFKLKADHWVLSVCCNVL